MWWASVSAWKTFSASTTSPMASLTTSSKRDMCAPFWLRPEIDEAVELGPVEPLGPVGADPDDLLDVRDPHARERDVQRRALGLDVLDEGEI